MALPFEETDVSASGSLQAIKGLLYNCGFTALMERSDVEVRIYWEKESINGR